MGPVSIISLLSGLAFFLFGMSLMGDALKRVAGSRLETVLGTLTSTRLRGVLLGTLVTAVIQSSSATTVMVVGFVNSGIMQLSQAIGIIMGANIGTTATGWILSLSSVGGSGVSELFSTTAIFGVIAIIGIILYMASKSTQRKNVGVILLALSVLMSGMKAMSTAMEPLQESEAFLSALTAVSNPLACILLGILITAIIQSCSASIGILQALAVTGVVGYNIAVPLVVGMSIGACVPVLLSAVGANRNGKRAAFTYLYFNLLGGAIFMVIYGVVTLATGGLTFLQGSATSVGIAIINTAFKTFSVVVLFPFIGSLEKLACRTFPDLPDEEDDAERNLLDERFLNYPPLALDQSEKTVELMAAAAFKNLNRSMDLIFRYDQIKFAKIISREDTVDHYEDKLGNYLVHLNSKELSAQETRRASRYLHSLTNLERISDHAVNIAELTNAMHDKGKEFSPQASAELLVCVDAVREIVTLAKESLVDSNIESALNVEPLEEVIDALTEQLKEQHIIRLQAGECTLSTGLDFNDFINNFERVADHCSNIAIKTIDMYSGNDLEAHDYLRTLKAGDSEDFRRRLLDYEKKYCGRLQQLESSRAAAASSAS